MSKTMRQHIQKLLDPIREGLAGLHDSPEAATRIAGVSLVMAVQAVHGPTVAALGMALIVELAAHGHSRRAA